MTKEEILAIVDQNASGNRSFMKLVVGFGIAMLAGAIPMFLLVEKPGNWPYIMGGVASSSSLA